MFRSLIFFVTIFGLTACVDFLIDENPKNSEQAQIQEILTNGIWQKSVLVNNSIYTSNQSDLKTTSVHTHSLSFNADGAFTSTSSFTTTANMELPDYLSINDIAPITSVGQYTLGQSIVTESGLTAMSIDLDWKIDDNTADTTLDIVYVIGAKLYFGAPRKLPSCENIEEPYYEDYDIAATNDPIDIGALDEAYIGHIQGCYGRPNALNFEQPYTRIFVAEGKLELITLDPDTTTIVLEPAVIESNEGETTTGEIDPSALEPGEYDASHIELDPSIFVPPLEIHSTN